MAEPPVKQGASSIESTDLARLPVAEHRRDTARASSPRWFTDTLGSLGGDSIPPRTPATDASRDALHDLFAELRAAAGQAGLGTWTQATFALAGSGAFSVQYGFDDFSDLGQASAGRDAWMAEHLGADARIKWR